MPEAPGAYTAYDGTTAYATSPSADVEIKTDYYKITGVADVTTAAVKDATVGKYKIVSTVSGDGVKITNDFAVRANATIKVEATWAGTDITGTKDTITVAMTGTKGTITNAVLEFAAGTYSDEVSKSATITTFTGDDTITITGANVIP